MPAAERPSPPMLEDDSDPIHALASPRPSTCSVSVPRPLTVSAPWIGVRMSPLPLTATVFAPAPVPALTTVGPLVDWTTTVLPPTPAVTVVVIVDGVETIENRLPLPPSVTVRAVRLL